MTEAQPVHSPLGASSAERWMNCPGSTALLKLLDLTETDEPEYRTAGIAAHEIAAKALLSGLDAWEEGAEPASNNYYLQSLEIDAVQAYLNHVRHLQSALPPKEHSVMVEYRISHPAHPKFYGTCDYGQYDPARCILDVVDYKHGEGIFVEVEWNPQLMYYAYGLLRQFPDCRTVRIHVCQPRIVYAEPVRSWEISAEALAQWAEETLFPAMAQAELDDTLDAGPWCRFCPAKLVCPLLTSLFGAAANANPKTVVNLDSESLGRSYQYKQAVTFYLKALEEETYRRLNAGKEVPGTKLVQKKANRVLKADAKAAFEAEFTSEELFTKPEFKSPPELEKLGPRAKALVAEWAYTPLTGYTVALEGDKRAAVKVQSTAEAFGAAVKLLAPETEPTEADKTAALEIPAFLKREK